MVQVKKKRRFENAYKNVPHRKGKTNLLGVGFKKAGLFDFIIAHRITDWPWVNIRWRSCASFTVDFPQTSRYSRKNKKRS